MKGLEQAIKNLNSINDEMVPKATAMAINRVARRVISHSVKRVSAETKVPQRLIRQRVRLNRASSRYKTPRARLVINRGNLPAIALGSARVQLSRKRGNQKGAGSVLKVGKFSFPNAFIQQLDNGRWHILQRIGKSRYPIEVVKIPLVTPLTTAYTEESEKLIESDMPKEMASALKQQLRLYIKGRVL